MYSTEFSKEGLRKIAEQKVNYRLSVKLHISLFFLGNFLLFLINLLFTPGFLWAFIPLFSWLIGLAIHITTYILYARGVYPMSKRGLIFVSVAVFFGSLQLAVINFITLGELNWSLIPIILGTAVILTYLSFYLIFLRHDRTQIGPIKSRKDKAVEKELEKMERKLERIKEK